MLTKPQSHRGTEAGLDGRAVGHALASATEALSSISEDARLEAEVMLGHAMGVDRARLLAMQGEMCESAELRAFDDLLVRRLAREPLAYIVGYREFYGLKMVCTPAALIPRPESEMLVSVALDETPTRHGIVSVCDVGTGSGAIAVAIAVNAPRARVVASDVSHDALTLARRNVAAHGVDDRVEVKGADLLGGLETCDVIVANLPYVSEREWEQLDPEIREHEPKEALVGGATGIEMIEQLFRDAPAHLRPGGVLAAEIGCTQATAALAAARASFPRARITLMRDLAGWERVLMVRTEGDA